MRRPAHLERRQQTGAAFGEAAVLINLTGTRDRDGEWQTDDPGPPEIPIRVSTEPAGPIDREIEDGVARAVARRVFFTKSGIDVWAAGMPGENRQASRIRWDGRTWQVDQVEEWRWGLRLVCDLMDPQP